MPDTPERITRLETLIGTDSKEGMRGEISDIKEVLNKIVPRIYMAIGGAAVIQFIIMIWATRK